MKSRKLLCGWRWYPVLGGLLLPLLAAGCGPAVGEVSGTVTYQGQPLGSGQIMFLGDKGTAPASIAADGTYTAHKVPVGTVQITVETIPPVSGGQGGNVAGMGLNTEGATTAAPGKYVKIPDKYKNARTSNLTYEVKSGKQQHDIVLQP
jgi:hypothetical protein